MLQDFESSYNSNSSGTRRRISYPNDNDDAGSNGSKRQNESLVADQNIDSNNGTVQQPQLQPQPRVENSSNSTPKEKAKILFQTLSIFDFINPEKEWVLVPDGSFVGVFNWVPENFRIGPWNPVAIIYLTTILYVTALSGVVVLQEQNQQEQLEHNHHPNENNVASSPSFESMVSSLEYPPLYSRWWWYHTISFCWMMYIVYMLMFQSPLGIGCWVTYTVQSWSILTIRHLLCALAPISQTALLYAEYIRFPAAASPTITFTMWNFVLFPYAYFIAMKSMEQKRNFFTFCTSFRMLNIHFANIVFCILNIKYASPSRILYWQIDFYIAVVSMILYMTLYLFILDRLGVHLYPIFSPRANTALVLFMWSLTFAIYTGLFYFWRSQLVPSAVNGGG